MLKIIKNLKSHILETIVILLLLVMQANCELALPQYTSDIVDIGISCYGVSENVPKEITEASYENLKLFMSQEEQSVLDASYSKEGEIYRINNLDSTEKDKLSDIMKLPMIAIYMIDSMDSMNIEQVKNMPEIARRAMYNKMADGTKGLGDDFTDTAARKFIVAEYQKTGADIDAMQLNYMLKTGGIMLLVSLVAVLCAIVAGFMAAKTAAKIGRDLRKNVFSQVVSYSNTELDKFSTASLITRSTNDIQQVQMATVMMLRMVLYAPVMGIGGIIKVLNTSTNLTWIIALGIILVLIVVATLFVVAMPKFNKMQTLVDRVNLVAREILTGIPVIRAFSREKHEEDRFAVDNRNLMKTQLFTSRTMVSMFPVMMFIMNGIAVLIIWFGGKSIDLGKMQVGDMMAFITYSMQIIMSFLIISMISIILPRAGVAANRIDEVLTTNTSILDKPDTVKTDIKGVIAFEDVSFAYPNAKENVLDDISFTAIPGKTTAFIGSTGCGKSTLINLIPRFYDVTSGRITIDGIDIRDMKQSDIRDAIGYVPQKAVLFSGTIASNIRFGNENATLDEVKSAVRIAQSTDFVEQKEKSYDSEIAQGGTNVSGGQKQRLSIARAIAKKPKIYIFDDSFSALDYKTDKLLRSELKKETGDSTVLIVAQRISTILDADQIIVLDDGKIAAVGTHKELMKTSDVYRQIAESQLSAKDIEATLKEV